MDPMDVEVPDINKLLERDPYLKPYEREIRRRYAVQGHSRTFVDSHHFFRYACYKDVMEKIQEHGGGVQEFTQGYKYFGVNVQADN